MDGGGRLWTAVDSGALCSNAPGRLWTLVDGLWDLRIRRLGFESLRARRWNPRHGGGCLSSPAEIESVCAFVGPRLGSETPARMALSCWSPSIHRSTSIPASDTPSPGRTDSYWCDLRARMRAIPSAS